MPDPAPEVGTNGPAAGCPPSRTGRQVRPCSSTPATVRAAAALGRCVSGPGRIVVVVDPDDTAEVAVDAGAACRRSGRFMVHAGPNQGGAARLQTEVLMALGKHWDRAAEGGDANGARLVRAWLRAEQARELTVLRAHQIRGAALVWLLGLAATEGLVVRLVSPEPLDALVAGHPEAELRSQPGPPDSRGRGRDGRHSGEGCDDGHPGVCEDLNAAALPPAPGSPRPTDTVTRRLRRLYDIEAASFATAAILLGCFDPDRLAAARPQVSADAARLSTLAETMVVPEHARALLRAWSGTELFPEDWADDVVATYLTLRLELAQRRTGLELIDPDLPAQVPVCWHCRFDPGASVLTWVMGSRCHEPGVGGHDHDDDVVDR